jgi:ATP phosphoribosyltransferase regulatory subunit
MAAETARQFQALEAQAQAIMGAFAKAGYEPVAPALIQPAGVFLDVVGEALRARTYVFTDPDGAELCLRPDITVPACRLYLERHPKADAKARYCYNGPAFRFQPAGAGATHPREFRQAGVEFFGETAKEKADAEVLAVVLASVKAAGLDKMKLRIGDVGLFEALLAATDMPDRWRRRLRHRFWRPAAFRAELQRLATAPGEQTRRLPADLQTMLDPSNRRGTERAVTRYLETNNIDLVGVRTVGEIVDRLLEGVEDARTPPLSRETVDLIDNYLKVTAPARAAGARLRDLMGSRGIDIGAALDSYHRRLEKIAATGIDLAAVEFAAEFGLRIEYYTGFVFELVVPDRLPPESPIAGGGRYDGLLKAVGAPRDVPAVGAAIHTERLLAIVAGQMS